MTFVVPTSLATIDDYSAWCAEAPADIPAVTAALRSCTILVLAATRYACYDTDPETGLATDPNILAAMRDATCIQAAAWQRLGIDAFTGGIDQGGVKASKKLGTASIEYAGAAQTAAARMTAASNLVPEAVQRLRQQNLITTAVGYR